ncbi:hypothetical protein OEA41_000349 [Lepraria neglecta]|uniref:Uncharacterized protein n=1 Tax=Lepraria neglecta TaxID=209136 RepID=A0AAD9ZFK5_9LECA|nr:hypothetical protein OEA41_000349 [Lepraria neglecta]
MTTQSTPETTPEIEKWPREQPYPEDRIQKMLLWQAFIAAKCPKLNDCIVDLLRGKEEAAETIAHQSTRLAELESIKTSAEATTAANFDARLKARDEEIAELKKKNKALSGMHASFLGNSVDLHSEFMKFAVNVGALVQQQADSLENLEATLENDATTGRDDESATSQAVQKEDGRADLPSESDQSVSQANESIASKPVPSMKGAISPLDAHAYPGTQVSAEEAEVAKALEDTRNPAPVSSAVGANFRIVNHQPTRCAFVFWSTTSTLTVGLIGNPFQDMNGCAVELEADPGLNGPRHIPLNLSTINGDKERPSLKINDEIAALATWRPGDVINGQPTISNFKTWRAGLHMSNLPDLTSRG